MTPSDDEDAGRAGGVQMRMQLRLEGFVPPRDVALEGPVLVAMVRPGTLPAGAQLRVAPTPAEPSGSLVTTPVVDGWDAPARKALVEGDSAGAASLLERHIREGLVKLDELAADANRPILALRRALDSVDQTWASLMKVAFPRAHALGQEIRRRDVPDWHLLRAHSEALAGAPDPLREFGGFVTATVSHERLLGYGIRWLLADAAFDRAHAVEVLRASAQRGRDGNVYWLRDTSIRALAATDWLAARAIVMDDPEDLRPGLCAALCNYASANDVRARLEAVGALVATPAPRERGMPPVTGDDWMVEAGLVHAVDSEAGAPADHDAWLAAVAGLLSPHLDGAAFAQRAPDDPDDDEQGYELFACDRGTTWCVSADNYRYRYDVFTCVGLLNALLAKRGAAPRVVFGNADCESLLIGAPRALLAAKEMELLDVWEPDA